MTKLKNDVWLNEPSLQKILMLLADDGEEARVVGGAVRNALLEKPVDDIDIACTRLPQNTIEHLKAHNIKCIPTGIDHGTITAVLDKKPFEITTLRADEDHDGRHAKVQFGNDWAGDAKRRDFTINAIYVDRFGEIYDPENGLADIETQKIRFIGDAEKRIHEDHLRILRFFRIYAHYGEGRPDPAALKACTRAKDSIVNLSSERIWSESKKLFSAKHLGKAIQWIRITGVLSVMIPESEKWGITAVPHLMEAEKTYGWTVDPFIRLMSIIPPRLERISSLIERLKLSNNEAKRLHEWVHAQDLPFEMDQSALAKTLYKNSPQAVLDLYQLELTRQMNAGEAIDDTLPAAIEFIQSWQKPKFPISGKDLMDLGMQAGQEMGNTLKALENQWIEQDFTPSKETLLSTVSK